MSIIERFRGKLLLFGKVIMPKVFYNGFCKVHHAIESAIISGGKKLNLIVPRGLGKTTIVAQVYPLYHIFVEEHTEPRFIVIVSKTQGHAINCLQAIKDVLDFNLDFRAIFGYYGAQTAQVWRGDMIVLSSPDPRINNTVIMAKGMGQPIRGLNYKGIRPSIIILDDPEDENNTKTPEAMDDNLLWLLKGALPAVDARFGRCLVIGTPLHQLCVVERLADPKMTEWYTIRYSYLEEFNGELRSIWEEMRSTESLMAMKEEMASIGRLSVFYAEYMCQIIGDEDQLFKPQYIKYHTYEHILEGKKSFLLTKEDNRIPVNIFMGIDPASSTKQTADYSVIMPIAVDKDDNRYILPYFRQRVSPMALADKIIEFYLRYMPEKTRIESVGYQEMLREYVRSKMYIPGLEIKESPRNSKSSRLESLEPIFAMGKVYLKEEMQELINELLTYPRSKNDDLLDGIYYASKNVYKPYHEAFHKEETKTISSYRKRPVDPFMLA